MDIRGNYYSKTRVLKSLDDIGEPIKLMWKYTRNGCVLFYVWINLTRNEILSSFCVHKFSNDMDEFWVSPFRNLIDNVPSKSKHKSYSKFELVFILFSWCLLLIIVQWVLSIIGRTKTLNNNNKAGIFICLRTVIFIGTRRRKITCN